MKFNINKTYLISIGTRQQLNKVVDPFSVVKTLDNDISQSDTVWNLGLIFESSLIVISAFASTFHKYANLVSMMNVIYICFVIINFVNGSNNIGSFD